MSQSDAIETLATMAAVEAVGSAMGGTCRNCGTELTGAFCARCGQSVHDRSKSIFKVVADALQDFIHFDSRVLRTLVMLVFVPGRMTRDYILGRRMQFVPPMRLYLFCSLMFFLTLSIANVALVVLELLPPDPTESQAEVEETMGELSQTLSRTGVKDRAVAAEIEAKTRTLMEAKEPMRFQMGDTSFVLPPSGGMDLRFFVDLDTWKPALKVATFAKAQLDAAQASGTDTAMPETPPAATPPAATPTPPAPESGAIKAQVQIDGTETFGESLFGKDWKKRLLLGIATSIDHPESLNKVLGDNIAKMMFVLMPIYALFLAILYVRQRLYLVDHLAFAFHMHAFIFLIFTAIVITREIGGLNMLQNADGAAWLLALFAVYSWIAMWRAYGQGWFRTTVKWMILGTFYMTLLMFGMIGVLMVSLPTV